MSNNPEAPDNLQIWLIRNGLGHEVGQVNIPIGRNAVDAIATYAAAVDTTSGKLLAAGYQGHALPASRPSRGIGRT